jgi:hypothetical protein
MLTSINAEEADLLHDFRKLSAKERNTVLIVARVMRERHDEEAQINSPALPDGVVPLPIRSTG